MAMTERQAFSQSKKHLMAMTERQAFSQSKKHLMY